MIVHQQTEGSPRSGQVRSGRSQGTEALIGGAVVLVLVILGIVVQQFVFFDFVHQQGGVPDGLFKKTNGSHYRLWSLTVPFWVMTVAIIGAGIAWAIRLRKLESPWYIIVAWLVYVIVTWSLFCASSGLVEVLGKGEAFI